MNYLFKTQCFEVLQLSKRHLVGCLILEHRDCFAARIIALVLVVSNKCCSMHIFFMEFIE